MCVDSWNHRISKNSQKQDPKKARPHCGLGGRAWHPIYGCPIFLLFSPGKPFFCTMVNTWLTAANHVLWLDAKYIHSMHTDQYGRGSSWPGGSCMPNTRSLAAHQWGGLCFPLSCSSLQIHTLQDYFWVQTMKKLKEI